MQFSSFAGNKDVVGRLAELLRSGRLPHALILEGPEGSGRRTLASIVAAGAVCSGIGERSCGRCLDCQKVQKGAHPDIFMVSGEGPRSFHIDVIRRIRNDAYVLPNEARRKVYILANAEAMTEQAQNALLKIFEEPPAHVVFILTCRDRYQLLPTIVSRAVTFALFAPDFEEAVRAVREREPKAREEEIRRAVEIAGGYVGVALKLLEKGGLSAAFELAGKVAKACLAGTELELLMLTANLPRDKELFRSMLNVLALIFRDVMAAKAGSRVMVSGLGDLGFELSQKMTVAHAAAALEVAGETGRALDSNANAALLCTRFCAALRRAVGK